MFEKTLGALAGLAVLGMTSMASAGPIISAVGATINSGGPGFGSITDTHNQAGLFATYTSGVTDFDTYIGANPIHDLVFVGNEWFGNEGASEASVTYDLGAATIIDAVALWNEDFSGIGNLDLFGSTDGVNFSSLLLGLAPLDTPNNTNYGPQTFSFGATNLQFVRFDLSACPQAPAGFDACAIGEVAFRAAETQVPEPGTLGMLGLGLAGLGFAFRRKAM